MRNRNPAGTNDKTQITLHLSQSAISALDQIRTRLGAHSREQVLEQILGGLTEDFRALEKITRRQRQVLEMICDGKTTKEIATLLGISAKTVEIHRAQLLKIANARCIAGLVRFAIRAGLIRP